MNNETEIAPYLPKEKTDEIRTLYRDGVRWPASPTCAITSKVKGQGNKVMSSVWFMFAHNSTGIKVAEAPKLAGSLSVPRVTLHISSKVKRSTVKLTRPLWVTVRHQLKGARHTVTATQLVTAAAVLAILPECALWRLSTMSIFSSWLQYEIIDWL